MSGSEAALCPREFSATAGVKAYIAPTGAPSLNDIFPDANALLFGSASVAKWILMFRMSKTCSGAVEASGNDLAFCPNKFGSVHEFLVAIDAAGREMPESDARRDAFSRFVFLLEMTREDEATYTEYKEGLYRTGETQQCAVRVRMEKLEESITKLDAGNRFPRQMSAAFGRKDYRWISCRRGKMLVCQGGNQRPEGYSEGYGSAYRGEAEYSISS